MTFGNETTKGGADETRGRGAGTTSSDAPGVTQNILGPAVYTEWFRDETSEVNFYVGF